MFLEYTRQFLSLWSEREKFYFSKFSLIQFYTTSVLAFHNSLPHLGKLWTTVSLWDWDVWPDLDSLWTFIASCLGEKKKKCITQNWPSSEYCLKFWRNNDLKISLNIYLPQHKDNAPLLLDLPLFQTVWLCIIFWNLCLVKKISTWL